KHVAEEVDQRLAGRAIRAVLARAGVRGEVRLVPEDVVDARVDRRVRPRADEVAIAGVVEARRRRRSPVGAELARVGVLRDERALGLASARAAEPPGRGMPLESAAGGGGEPPLEAATRG